jgi:hypothetical protein
MIRLELMLISINLVSKWFKKKIQFSHVILTWTILIFQLSPREYFIIPHISMLHFYPLFHIQVYYHPTVTLLVSFGFTLKLFHVFPCFIYYKFSTFRGLHSSLLNKFHPRKQAWVPFHHLWLSFPNLFIYFRVLP